MTQAEELLDRVRARLRTFPSCGVPDVDVLVVDALVPGKLLRPDLVVRSALAAHGPGPLPDVSEQRIVQGALAMELLHVATLVHDDIIDGASLRRGRPSTVAIAGPTTALLVGDLLLARSAAAAADSSPRAAAAWARTLGAMAAGQLREPGLVAAPSLAAHEVYARLKTAELFRASAEVGAAAVDASPDLAHALGCFGLHLGAAFQHLDDLLDEVGDDRALGKPTGADARNGVPTAVSMLAEQGRRDDVADLVDQATCRASLALRDRPEATDLARWGAGALRRTLRGGLGRQPALAPRVEQALSRLDHHQPNPTTEETPCRTSLA